ncbi:hypothetical protein HPP92_013179 [Vanilla planifolia]|uniref:Uncharacterized protein n=1 Tax=Vanilla planifolia TaxID=51239 RepID=A0A835QR78_VANPL|nr:hypothetical protein HPP92_013179 [Vanilla planifolia]
MHISSFSLINCGALYYCSKNSSLQSCLFELLKMVDHWIFWVQSEELFFLGHGISAAVGTPDPLSIAASSRYSFKALRFRAARPCKEPTVRRQVIPNRDWSEGFSVCARLLLSLGIPKDDFKVK